MKPNTSAYINLHTRIRKKLGTPTHCVECGLNDKNRVYDWANISGQYSESLNDWKRLCRSCHYKFDRKNLCKKRIHELIEENLYIAPKTGIRECLSCRRAYRLQYKLEYGK